MLSKVTRLSPGLLRFLPSVFSASDGERMLVRAAAMQSMGLGARGTAVVLSLDQTTVSQGVFLALSQPSYADGNKCGVKDKVDPQ